MSKVLQQAEDRSSVIKTTAWCLAKFLLGDPPAPPNITRALIPTLAQTLLRTEMLEVTENIMAGISRYASDTDDDALICLLEQEGLLDKFFELIYHEN